MKDYMRLNEFIRETGIPRKRIVDALHGEYRNQVGQKLTRGHEGNSPWLIDVARTKELFKKGYI